MVVRKLCIIIFVVVANFLGASAQMKAWDKLQIGVPEGWSSKQKDGHFQYSNYNLGEGEPFAITLFSAQPYEGKPDTLFAHVWKTHVTDPPVAKEIPRWRRYYTEDGMLVQQGFVDFPDKENPLYRQLNVFVLDSSYQACLIETTSNKAYKQVQNEWQERLLGVKKIGKKKNK
jgi:hypothetical protein